MSKYFWFLCHDLRTSPFHWIQWKIVYAVLLKLWKWKNVRLMTFKARELRGKGNSEKAKRVVCVWKICNEKCIFCHGCLTIKTICSVHWSKRRKAVNSDVCGSGNVWNESRLLRRQEVINGEADDEAVFVFVTSRKNRFEGRLVFAKHLSLTCLSAGSNRVHSRRRYIPNK